jgi:hypothetical protein
MAIPCDALIDHLVTNEAHNSDSMTFSSFINSMHAMTEEGVQRLSIAMGSESFVGTLSPGVAAFIPMGYIIVEFAQELNFVARGLCTVVCPEFEGPFRMLNSLLQKMPALATETKIALQSLADGLAAACKEPEGGAAAATAAAATAPKVGQASLGAKPATEAPKQETKRDAPAALAGPGKKPRK